MNYLCFHLPGQGGVTWQFWQVEKNIRVLINAFLFSFASHGNNIHIKKGDHHHVLKVSENSPQTFLCFWRKFFNPCIFFKSSLFDQVLIIPFKSITKNIVEGRHFLTRKTFKVVLNLSPVRRELVIFKQII